MALVGLVGCQGRSGFHTKPGNDRLQAQCHAKTTECTTLITQCGQLCAALQASSKMVCVMPRMMNQNLKSLDKLLMPEATKLYITLLGTEQAGLNIVTTWKDRTSDLSKVADMSGIRHPDKSVKAENSTEFALAAITHAPSTLHVTAATYKIHLDRTCDELCNPGGPAIYPGCMRLLSSASVDKLPEMGELLAVFDVRGGESCGESVRLIAGHHGNKFVSQRALGLMCAKSRPEYECYIKFWASLKVQEPRLQQQIDRWVCSI